MSNGPPADYETGAELWLSNKSGAFSTIRKLQTAQHRRKNDKRESVAQLSALTEGGPKKLREKPSWLSMSRGYATTASGGGQWLKVKCFLGEDPVAGTCILTIVGEDKGTLQHSLHVNLLRATDIRFADRSLFLNSDCLAIHARQSVFALHSPSLQSLMPVSSDGLGLKQTHRRQQSGEPILEPIYLSFESRDAVNCWNALLRSYAQPEIYGRHIDRRGLYRMWRQVELKVVYGRNLGASGKLASTDGLTSDVSLLETERGDGQTEGSADLEVFCEIILDCIVSGRTTVKKGQAGLGMEPPNWTWYEGFIFSDLPPFGALSIRVWREKKSAKPALVGTVELALANFRRGQFVDGWFPVLSGGNGIQVGDLKLKIKVDEEIILPSEAYASIAKTLDNRNCLDLLSELDQKMQLGDISLHMMSLAVGRGTFLEDLLDLAEREVNNAPNANTLFRGNSVFTKTVEQAMTFFGKSFLEASVGPCIYELCTDRVEIETDPSRNPHRPKDVENSVRLLPIWCAKFWDQIYRARSHCPPELRRLFQCIRELVENRFGAHAADLRWQSVSAFCFLRLIVPAILHPHLFGLHPGLPSPGLSRSLTLIAKAMQSLANLSREQKEVHMQSIAGFLEQENHRMIKYIVDISGPVQDRGHPDMPDSRLRIMQALRERKRTSTPLVSESIPVLPHLLDIPKHLAVLSSAVIQHARSTPQPVASRPVPLSHESIVEDFAIKCFEIEAKAVHCVSRLASPTTSAPAASRHSRRVPSRRSSSPPQDGRAVEHTKRAPYTPPPDSHMPHVAVSQPRPRRTSSRPSTAPAAPSSSGSSTFHTPVPSPPLMESPTMPTFHRPTKPSIDSSATSSASSPRVFQSNTRVEQIPVSAMPSSSSNTNPESTNLRRTLSQQLQITDNIDDAAARRRGGFLRSLLRGSR